MIPLEQFTLRFIKRLNELGAHCSKPYAASFFQRPGTPEELAEKDCQFWKEAENRGHVPAD